MEKISLRTYMDQVVLGTQGYKVNNKVCFLSSYGPLLIVRHNPVSRQLQHIMIVLQQCSNGYYGNSRCEDRLMWLGEMLGEVKLVLVSKDVVREGIPREFCVGRKT